MQAGQKFQILEGLPPYGPVAESFCEKGSASHSEGFVVRFFPVQGESWVGNFPSQLGGYNAVLEHPNKRDFIVISGGDAHVIDPETRQCFYRFGSSIYSAIEIPEMTAIIFENGLWFEAIGVNGHLWRSGRISWDGFQNLKHEGLVLSGEAWSPPDNCWYPFTLDLNSGEFTGGCPSLPQ